jgi:dipeptidase E
VRAYLSSFRIGDRPQELLRLLRGRTRTALVVNADDYKDEAARIASLEREVNELRGLGLEPFEVDLRDYFGRGENLHEVLSSVDLIYVRGGNGFVLRRAFKHSAADDILRELLANDRVVYAGYSAGPIMLGPTLRGIQGQIDDPTFIPEGYPNEPPTYECLSVLPYVVVPHYRSEHPESEEIERTVAYLIAHHIPFIALRDGQALVIDGTRSTVVD